jgi:ribosomal 50S subunit-associated protein YjgA (DUF615 family)
VVKKHKKLRKSGFPKLRASLAKLSSKLNPEYMQECMEKLEKLRSKLVYLGNKINA